MSLPLTRLRRPGWIRSPKSPIPLHMVKNGLPFPSHQPGRPRIKFPCYPDGQPELSRAGCANAARTLAGNLLHTLIVSPIAPPPNIVHPPWPSLWKKKVG